METKEILDTSVAIGKKEGTITVFTGLEYPTSFKALFEIIFPEDEDYIKAIQIANSLKEKGRLIGAIDILISAMCLNRNTKLVTKDNDFKAVKEVFSEFKLEVLK